MGKTYELERKVEGVKIERSLEAEHAISAERGLLDLEISEIELRIREDVRVLSDEELTKLYQSALQGANYDLNAPREGYIEGLPNWQGHKDKLTYLFTRSRNINKYDFLRKQLQANPNKKLKVGKHELRRYIPIKDLFEECYRTLEVLKETAKRNL